MQFRNNKPVHGFTIRAQGIARIITLDIEICSVGDNLKRFPTKGIWDTGATGTVITKEVCDFFNLPQTGVTTVNTASESNISKPTYLIDVFLKKDLVVGGITVTSGTVSAEHGICCLIGMDIICLGDFSITNFNGNTCMSFRIPSLHEVDFVSKIAGHNKVVDSHFASKKDFESKCICGSGKKFKNCHGKDLEKISS